MGRKSELRMVAYLPKLNQSINTRFYIYIKQADFNSIKNKQH